MTRFLILSQLLVFLHIACGELAGASLLWGIKEALFLTESRLKWLRASLWIAFAGVMMAWLAGGTYYLFFYPTVKPVIKEGPEAWAHLIFMEAKEHIFFIIPVLLFVLAYFAHVKGKLLLEHPPLRKKFAVLAGFGAILIFSMAIMGYMITWGARTALWLKSGL